MRQWRPKQAAIPRPAKGERPTGADPNTTRRTKGFPITKSPLVCSICGDCCPRGILLPCHHDFTPTLTGLFYAAILQAAVDDLKIPSHSRIMQRRRACGDGGQRRQPPGTQGMVRVEHSDALVLLSRGRAALGLALRRVHAGTDQSMLRASIACLQLFCCDSKNLNAVRADNCRIASLHVP